LTLGLCQVILDGSPQGADAVESQDGVCRLGATSAARSEPTRHEGWSGFEENIGAVDIEFTPDDLRDIDSAAKIMIHGARCPEHLERRTNL
jgi:hypothetical protein